MRSMQVDSIHPVGTISRPQARVPLGETARWLGGRATEAVFGALGSKRNHGFLGGWKATYALIKPSRLD